MDYSQPRPHPFISRGLLFSVDPTAKKPAKEAHRNGQRC